MKMNNFLLALILIIFFVSISSVNAGFGNDVRGIRDIVSNTNPTPTPEPEPPTNNTTSTDP